ncbi:MAG: hypothetical protein IKK43_04445 [Clostridia bacterium]|nr:hypothetical protein [Clostridia bacterium]
MKINYRRDMKNRHKREKTPTNNTQKNRQKDAMRSYDPTHKPRGGEQRLVMLAIDDYYVEDMLKE